VALRSDKLRAHSHAKSWIRARRAVPANKSIRNHIITASATPAHQPSGLDYVNLSTSLKSITIHWTPASGRACALLSSTAGSRSAMRDGGQSMLSTEAVDQRRATVGL